MHEYALTTAPGTPPGRARRIFRSPLVRLLVLGFLLLMMPA
jgi:hypothetical protein